MDNTSLLDLGGSQALLQALRRVKGVGEEVGVEKVLDDDFFRANHLSSEDRGIPHITYQPGGGQL